MALSAYEMPLEGRWMQCGKSAVSANEKGSVDGSCAEASCAELEGLPLPALCQSVWVEVKSVTLWLAVDSRAVKVMVLQSAPRQRQRLSAWVCVSLTSAARSARRSAHRA